MIGWRSVPVALDKLAVAEFARYFQFPGMVWRQRALQCTRITEDAQLLSKSSGCCLKLREDCTKLPSDMPTMHVKTMASTIHSCVGHYLPVRFSRCKVFCKAEVPLTRPNLLATHRILTWSMQHDQTYSVGDWADLTWETFAAAVFGLCRR